MVTQVNLRILVYLNKIFVSCGWFTIREYTMFMQGIS